MHNDLTTTLNSLFLNNTPPEDLIELAKIATAHGVRGWVKVNCYSSQPEALLKSKIWWLQSKQQTNKWRALAVNSCNKHGGDVLLVKFAGVNDRDLAIMLQSHTVWLSRDDFPDTASDEFYWVDLIGCKFYGQDDNNQVLIGRVSEVVENNAHAILTIEHGDYADDQEFKPCLDDKKRVKTTLVPFVSAHIESIDLQSKRIISNWPADF